MLNPASGAIKLAAGDLLRITLPTDPAQAIIYLLEHHGQARFQDVEHRRIAILSGIHADLEQFLYEFRKGAVTGDKRRNNEEVRAKLDDIVREMQGEKTKSRPAREMAQAMAEVIEQLRQRFNAAGGHVPKLDNYMPQHHNPEALTEAGRTAWVDYMMRKGVLARHKMLGLDGKPLSDADLREGLEISWERITTDGWIDRQPSVIPTGQGPLHGRYDDARFIHFKDADAWLDYKKHFGGGDPSAALLGYIAKMSRDIAFMEVLGPNPDATKTWLQQIVLKQAAVAKPAASVVAEQTAMLKGLVAKATGGGKYDTLVRDVGKIVDDLADLQRRLDVHGGRDLQLEHRIWNRTEELERIQREIGDLDAGSVVVRRAQIGERLAAIEKEIDAVAGKAAPQLGGDLSKRNKQRLTRLRGEESRLKAELDTLAQSGETLARVDPELAGRLKTYIDAMRGDLSRAAHADDLSGLEGVLEGVVKSLVGRVGNQADTAARLSGKATRLGKARDALFGEPAPKTIDETLDSRIASAGRGPEARPEQEALGVFKSILAAIGEWRKTGHLRLRDYLTENLDKALKDYHGFLDQMGVDQAQLRTVMEMVQANEAAFLRPQGFRAVDDPMSSARASIARMDQMWDVMRGNSEAPQYARFANAMQAGRNVMSAALLGQASLASLTDVAFQRVARSFAGLDSGMLKIMGSVVSQFSTANRREAVRAGLILDSALHVMQTQARYLEAVDTRSLTGYMADRVITFSGLSAWTQAGKHAFGMAFQSEIAERVKIGFFELPDMLRQTFERHGLGSAEWDIMRKAELYNPEDGLHLLRPKEIANIERNPRAREVAEMYIAMIHRETKFAIPEGTVRTQSMLKTGQPGSIAGELSRNFAQFKSFGAAVMMQHGGRIAREWQGERQGRAVSMAASLLVTGAIAGAFVIELKDIVNGRDPRGIKQLIDGNSPGGDYWMQALLQAGGLGILGDFLFSGVNRIGGGLSSFVVGPFGGQVDRMRDRTFGNIDEFAKGENMKLGREMVATTRDLMPGGTLWYLRLAKERLLMNQIEAMVDPEAAKKGWKRLETAARKKNKTEYWWRPGELQPRRGPLQQAVPDAPPPVNDRLRAPYPGELLPMPRPGDPPRPRWTGLFDPAPG